MPDPIRRVAVLTHLYSEAAGAALSRLDLVGRRLGLELLLPSSEAGKHPDAARLGYRVVDDEEARHSDLCLVFGGDGTVLRALGRLLGSDVPTLGVNYGKVGFLAALPQEAWVERLESIVRGDYRVVELLTVEVDIAGRRHGAVNDVILTRIAPRHVLQLEYEVAGATVGTMSCDGLIVAAPAGSTAYNLSCGGPIVEWNADVLVLNFIAPHSLAFRPVVLHPRRTIIARNVSFSQEAEVVVDGETVGRLARGDAVSISAGEARARLLVTSEGSFCQNVEEKLFDPHNAR
jgi:NAD+ kinase